MIIEDGDIKRAALIGLRHQRQRMDELILRLERELGTGTVVGDSARPATRKRRLSAAGRANIVAALRKRWAAVKQAKRAPKPTVSKAAGKTAPKKVSAKRKAAAKKVAAKIPAQGSKKAATRMAKKTPVKTKTKPAAAKTRAAAKSVFPAKAAPAAAPATAGETSQVQEPTVS